ncbi:hypothetical protein VCV18_008990 [Metarhizium anisopliae]
MTFPVSPPLRAFLPSPAASASTSAEVPRAARLAGFANGFAAALSSVRSVSWILSLGFVGRVVRLGGAGLSVSTTIGPSGGSAISMGVRPAAPKQRINRWSYLQNNKDLNLRSQNRRPKVPSLKVTDVGGALRP